MTARRPCLREREYIRKNLWCKQKRPTTRTYFLFFPSLSLSLSLLFSCLSWKKQKGNTQFAEKPQVAAWGEKRGDENTKPCGGGKKGGGRKHKTACTKKERGVRWGNRRSYLFLYLSLSLSLPLIFSFTPPPDHTHAHAPSLSAHTHAHARSIFCNNGDSIAASRRRFSFAPVSFARPDHVEERP